MKKSIYILSVASMSIALSGCGGGKAEATNRAEDLCECLSDAGLDENVTFVALQDGSMRKMQEKMQTQVPKCALKVFKAMEKDLDDLSKKEKKEYTKSFLKACIDTDCSDIVLGLIPYDMMGIGLAQLEMMLNRESNYEEEMNQEWDDEDWEEEEWDEESEEQLEELF